ncbi:AraC family transcriptional regulator [Streptomyces sp. NPDC059255]|uniref:AraC family transcriptional regulator n=1 Tax=Streptomyces sp. NPDC059255 TaxID=3346793 RepID=UPI00368432D8
MIETVFSTSDVHVADRFDCWRERMVNLHAPMDLSSDYVGDYRAEMRFLQLGTTCVWPAAMRPVRHQRTPRLIGQSDPEGYNLTFMLRGTKRLAQAGMEGACGPGDLQIVDTSQPYDCHAIDSAAAHHISVSYLHRVFQAHDRGTTVSAWIRHQRLEAARRDLADPALRAVPVHRIGTGWGFTQHAVFSRAFHAAYGVPPRDYRHRALSAEQ